MEGREGKRPKERKMKVGKMEGREVKRPKEREMKVGEEWREER